MPEQPRQLTRGRKKIELSARPGRNKGEKAKRGRGEKEKPFSSLERFSVAQELACAWRSQHYASFKEK